ncbi:hypothetical protein HDU76_008775, partial [Blyttiomyces sp. JEL0837]
NTTWKTGVDQILSYLRAVYVDSINISKLERLSRIDTGRLRRLEKCDGGEMGFGEPSPSTAMGFWNEMNGSMQMWDCGKAERVFGRWALMRGFRNIMHPTLHGGSLLSIHTRFTKSKTTATTTTTNTTTSQQQQQQTRSPQQAIEHVTLLDNSSGLESLKHAIQRIGKLRLTSQGADVDKHIEISSDTIDHSFEEQLDELNNNNGNLGTWSSSRQDLFEAGTDAITKWSATKANQIAEIHPVLLYRDCLDVALEVGNVFVPVEDGIVHAETEQESLGARDGMTGSLDGGVEMPLVDRGVDVHEPCMRGVTFDDGDGDGDGDGK